MLETSYASGSPSTLSFVPITPTTPSPPPAGFSTLPPTALPNGNSNYGEAHMPGSIPPGDFTENTDAGYGGGRYAPGSKPFLFLLIFI